MSCAAVAQINKLSAYNIQRDDPQNGFFILNNYFYVYFVEARVVIPLPSWLVSGLQKRGDALLVSPTVVSKPYGFINIFTSTTVAITMICTIEEASPSSRANLKREARQHRHKINKSCNIVTDFARLLQIILICVVCCYHKHLHQYHAATTPSLRLILLKAGFAASRSASQYTGSINEIEKLFKF